MRAKPVWPFAGASAGACALGLIAAASLVPEAARSAAVYGAAAAALSGACALAALVLFADRGINGLLAGFGLGFLARGIFIAIGLIASGARGNFALIYVTAFFTLYAVTQAIEVLFVHRTSHAEGTSA